jgi:hypothetical protein
LTTGTPLKIPRGATATVQILEGNSRPLTRSQLIAAAGEPVRTVIGATCLWESDAWIGDYRYVVFNICPEKRVDVFVQLWSEPDAPARWEVCSGQFNRATARWLPKDLGEKLRRLGFSLPDASEGAGPQNYARNATIRGLTDVAAAAETVLALFHDLFGYRGLTPIDVSVEYGTRAEERPVYSSFTPGDICKIAAAVGCSARVVGMTDDEGACAIEVRKGRVRAELLLGDRAEDQRLYASGLLGSSEVPSDAKTGAGKALKPYRLGRQPKAWRLGITLHFEGGVTAEWVAGRIAYGMNLIGRTIRGRRKSSVRKPLRAIH